jgi:hypothetical protein
MKSILAIIVFYLIAIQAFAQNNNTDSMKIIETTGVFEGKLVREGNFDWEMVYKINEYCIAKDDISQNQFDSLKGKKVLVKGILKVKEGEYGPVKSSNDDGTIYEPYKEPDKLFVLKPQFTIFE